MASNAIVGQSGGPTAAINATLAGVFTGAKKAGIDTVFGTVNGIEGILKNTIVKLDEILTSNDQIEILKTTPASFLGSCRYKLPKDFSDPTVFEQIFSFFRSRDIRYFFYIGGNDSMDTVAKLSEYAKQIDYDIQIIGVPKTIDNDLAVTDHTPGFGSAAKYIAASVKEVARDSDVYDLKSVTIIEIMGRHAGWLTAASALSRCENSVAPHLIYLPEVPFSYEKFTEDVKHVQENYSNVIVCVSEGIKTKEGSFVCESASSGLTDVFGHKCLSGTAKVLENYVRDTLGCKARGIELNVLQRAAGHLLSRTDIEESFSFGQEAVLAAMRGETGKMIIGTRSDSESYQLQFSSTDIKNAANAEKTVPLDYISDGKNDVTEEFIKYASPLIQGEIYPQYQNGLPVHLVLK